MLVKKAIGVLFLPYSFYNWFEPWYFIITFVPRVATCSFCMKIVYLQIYATRNIDTKFIKIIMWWRALARGKFAFILDNFDNVEEIMILSKWNYCVEFKLPFTWALATWGLLCGSVALQYTWNLLTFSPPVLRVGTVHGLCHSSSYV